VLAAVPSLLFLAVTQQLTLDVAPVPFLWVLPLVLYLFTFVLCFEFSRLLPRRLLSVLAAASAAVVGLVLAMPYLLPDFRLQLLVVCSGLFAMMLFCHAELYAHRPAPQHLTRFYLMTALGGALGGSFVGLAAHHLFRGYYEVYVGLAGCAAIAVFLEWKHRSRRDGDFEVTFPIAACVFSLSLVLSLPFLGAQRDGLRVERNFFGALRVVEGREHGLPAWRQLDHGSTKHGLQLLSHQRRCEAVAYYSADSAVGRVMQVLHRMQPSVRIGVIGLGVGTVAAYARPPDALVFYEINPLMERIAREDFTYLSECAPQAAVRIGDARILLEQEAPNGFDILLVDAFSGDSIPTHLLTGEAFAVYRQHLSPDGVILVNISNRYLDLRSVVRAGGERAGLQSTFVGSSEAKDPHVFAAVWALLEKSPGLSQALEVRTASARTPQPAAGLLWTDDFSNLLRVLQK
jgi:predicted O-methyltransferase YrrM